MAADSVDEALGWGLEKAPGRPAAGLQSQECAATEGWLLAVSADTHLQGTHGLQATCCLVWAGFQGGDNDAVMNKHQTE